MSAAALDHTYRYRFASQVGEFDRGFGLCLATCDVAHESPYFFDARLRHPRATGDMLLVLSNVVRTHYFIDITPLLDPVVTSNDGMLRFEGFSGCSGVYVRADLPDECFDTDLAGRGTTNVDFNDPMRAALTRLHQRDDARLAVGADEVALERAGETTIEKKVKLPVRWIKGFCEVQAYQPGLQLRYEVPIAEARRFLRSLPRSSAPKQPSFITQTGRALRLSQRGKARDVRMTGMQRLRALEPLLTAAKQLRIWANADNGVSGWEVVFESGRFFLLMSPELYRGFSGEGQALDPLATAPEQATIDRVRTELAWQSQIDSRAVARKIDVDANTVQAALAALGSRGLAGFDVNAGAYFHRELPFDIAQVEALHPRLKNARALIEKGQVKIMPGGSNESNDVEVAGTDVTHLVRLRPDLDKCTCPWFSKYQGQRGPCKHILAARLMVDGDEGEAS